MKEVIILNNLKDKGIRFTSLFLSFASMISFYGCSLKKDTSSFDNKSITYSSSKTENEDIIIESSKYADSEKVYGTISLEELKKNLDVNTNHLSDDIKDYLMNNITSMYNNGKKIEKILSVCDFPNIGYVINEKIIEPLKNIKEIEIIRETDNDYEEKKEKYNTSNYDTDNKMIHIFLDTGNEDEFFQILLEEIIHSSQKKLLSDEDNYSSYALFAEGEANFLSFILAYGKVDNDCCVMFYDDDTMNTASIAYGLGHNTHSLASKYYLYLMYLSNYMNVDIYKETLDSKLITDIISKKYNIDSEELYFNMNNVIVDSKSNILTKRTDMLIDVENMFLKCLSADIDKIDNKDDACKFMDFFRYVNIQFGYECIEYNSEKDEYYDKTDERISRKEIIDKLYNLNKKYKIINDSEDETTNKKAFYAILNSKKISDDRVHEISIFDYDIKLSGNNLILKKDNFVEEINIVNGNCSYYDLNSNKRLNY